MDTAGLIALIATLDAASIDFHAARYDSADKYQRLIRDAQDDMVTTDDLENRVYEIACATPYDGGDFLTIPCLGGEPQSIWESVCYFYKEMLDFARPYALADLQQF